MVLGDGQVVQLGPEGGLIMAGGREVIDEANRRVEEATLAIAGACLTDAQLNVLASLLEGQSATEIIALFRAVLPPENARAGILLPYITEGKLREFPVRAIDLVVLLLGLHAQAEAAQHGGAANPAALAAISGSANALLAGAVSPALASREFERAFSNRLRAQGEQVSPPALWAAATLTPRTLGTGYNGSNAIKGAAAWSAFGIAKGGSRAVGSDMQKAVDAVTTQGGLVDVK